MKRRFFCAALCLVLVPAAFAQDSGSSKITRAAVWQLPSSFVAQAHKACDAASGGSALANCFIDQMSKSGAPAASVNFSKLLYKASGGEVGILTGFQPVGPVDIGWVTYPLRANTNYGLVFVNGKPALVNVEDLKSLAHKDMEQDPQFQNLKAQYPKVSLWAGDRSGAVFPNSQPGPNGGVQFTVGYPLLNGCHACARVGTAMFQWNFDANGKFTGTSFIGLTDNQ